MERPAKRQRLSLPPGSPEEVTEEWDLQAARARNDMRLKSIFEGIFSKYGKDFTEVGDEIDLRTGKIVVDNGHLSGMHEEKDIGDEQSWLDENDFSEGDENEIDKGQEPSMGNSQGETPVPSNIGETDSFWNASTHHQSANLFKPVIQPSDPFENDRPTDPVWQAPDLPALFSTPTAETKRKGVPKLPHFERETSPPGSGSLWSVPRRGRPRTEAKPKTTPSQIRVRAKRKYHSSPVAHDWSFAATPDGDESDDPLQEFQPSPSLSKGAKNIRGKRMQASTRTARLPSPDARPPLSPSDQSATQAHDNKLQNHARKGAESHVAFDASSSQYDSYAHPHSHVLSATETPVKSKRGLTPEDAKLVVRMRHIQKKKWNEIHDLLPHRSRSQIYQWNLIHWTERRANPPQLSAPWTQFELETLDRLKEESGLTWLDITSSIPNRTKAEIEFELLRLWVGDEVWIGQKREPEREFQQDEKGSEDEVDVPEVVPSIEVYSGPDTDEPRIFEDLIGDDDPVDNISTASSPSKLSAIYLDSPIASRQGSRTPKRASPVKHLKFTI
ncbi:hypothetical protein N7490_005461 [Penicillium lividum]|nr:hypothetical protein N7490_005461 [Penicillium lividum]